MNTGDRIKYLREEKGLTLTELGEAVGTTKQTIYKYENGIVTNIPLDRLGKLAGVLDTTPAYLCEWTDDPYDYDLDPDSRFSVVPSAWLDEWRRAGLTAQQMWERYTAIENDRGEDKVDLALLDYLEILRTRPECRMLFSLTKDATKEDVEKAVAIITALRSTEGK